MYGWNNAGKSALLRLLPILADSTAESTSSPFDLVRTYGKQTHFRDVLTQFAPPTRLTICLEWEIDEGEHLIDRIVLKLNDSDQVEINSLEVLNSSKEQMLKAERDPRLGDDMYQAKLPEQDSFQISITFTGLVPAENLRLPVLSGYRDRIRGLRGRVHYLQAVRNKPEQRVIVQSASKIKMLDPTGSDALQALLASKQALTDVKKWYAGSDIGRRLDFEEVNHPYVKPLLGPMEGVSAKIHLLDTGEGMMQVLPVLTATALASAQEGWSCLAVEEPESHLHGNAQRALAFHLAEVAGGDSPPVIVAETHSRLLLLGVQLALAQGKVEPERVCAYWVDQTVDGKSQAELIEFDKHGRPLRGWPRSTFIDDQDLARLLLDEQLKSGAYTGLELEGKDPGDDDSGPNQSF